MMESSQVRACRLELRVWIDYTRSSSLDGWIPWLDMKDERQNEEQTRRNVRSFVLSVSEGAMFGGVRPPPMRMMCNGFSIQQYPL